MSDKNLRKEIAKLKWWFWHLPMEAQQKYIDSIHAAIAKDREEEREYCKEQVKAKMKDNVQNFAGGK